jgi:hypothetical protein
MSTNEWVSNNYEEILKIAKNVNQGKGDHIDLAHYTIEKFLINTKAQELVDKGHAKWFITRILTTSAQSKTSGYWREYRSIHNEELVDSHLTLDEPYDIDKDIILEWLAGMLDDMKHSDVEDWYRGTILQLCLNQQKINFSELSRETGIPRTSIANAYAEGLEIIKQKIEQYGNNYDTFRTHLLEYLSHKS